ncbi:TolC family protein [Fontisphaera persica]|uniref:TolC family protein n=1 Tax=Fontisphaera persica TaxID=2974023 RepID=UPI0024BF6E32|nr:TolC family protein [Fontisphaera persica]WCJ60256.1 TolC family protein [Fontisphaera persica]
MSKSHVMGMMGQGGASGTPRGGGWAWGCLGLAAMLALTGCLGRTLPQERAARKEVAAVGQQYRPGEARPALPVLSTNSLLSEFVLYGVLNHPRVEAAYYEWKASVEKITTARSLPDPRLTFQSDVAGTLMALMPGLMMEFPGPGKLRAEAAMAAAESDARYYAFESEVLEAAYAVRKSYYQLYFLRARIAVLREMLKWVADTEMLAQAQHQVGKVTLQDVLRAQIERQRLETEIANLEDAQQPLLTQFNAALGRRDTEETPPLPAQFQTTPDESFVEDWLREVETRHPRLRAMAAEIRQAEAAVAVARKGRVPDFSVGLELNAYASPLVASPQAGVTLPIWKDKIAAEIAAAQGRRRAAEARLLREQIQLAVEWADRSFMVREATRMIELFRGQLIPKARLSLEVGRENYRAGLVDYFNLAEAQRTLLEFQLAEINARAQRELALSEMSLLLAGRLPEGAPQRPVTEKETSPSR